MQQHCEHNTTLFVAASYKKGSVYAWSVLDQKYSGKGNVVLDELVIC